MRPSLRLLLTALSVALVAMACSRANPLLSPRPSAVAAPAPDSFLVRFETTDGAVVMKARRHWAPQGVDRLYYLVRNGFYDGARFFRVVPNFVVQFGLPADPAVAAVWHGRTIPDDMVTASNQRGTVSFARSGPASRTTQLFVNLRNNARLDTLGGFGFPPVGEIVEGMGIVDSLYAGYGDPARAPSAPVQDSIRLQGNAYLDRRFPNLDAVRTARVVTEWPSR